MYLEVFYWNIDDNTRIVFISNNQKVTNIQDTGNILTRTHVKNWIRNIDPWSFYNRDPQN